MLDGRIHLAGITVLRKHLTDANYEVVFAKATHKTREEIEVLVAGLAPKPDVPTKIRERPQRRATAKPAEPTVELCLDTVEQAVEARLPPKPEPPPVVQPLAPTRYKVEFTASEELRDKLKRLEAKRYGKVKKPRKNLEDADTAPGVRGISAPVRRFVWERDGGQCTLIGAEGRRCPERHRLEFHHDDPFGLGGDRSADNVRLLCKTAQPPHGRKGLRDGVDELLPRR